MNRYGLLNLKTNKLVEWKVLWSGNQKSGYQYTILCEEGTAVWMTEDRELAQKVRKTPFKEADRPYADYWNPYRTYAAADLKVVEIDIGFLN